MWVANTKPKQVWVFRPFPISPIGTHTSPRAALGVWRKSISPLSVPWHHSAALTAHRTQSKPTRAVDAPAALQHVRQA